LAPFANVMSSGQGWHAIQPGLNLAQVGKALSQHRGKTKLILARIGPMLTKWLKTWKKYGQSGAIMWKLAKTDHFRIIPSRR